MDTEAREFPTAARWLAWVAALLLAVAGISASVVEARNGRSDEAFVSAAGGSTSTIDVPASSTTTTTVVRPSTSVPPPTVARSTTVPKAAAAVLAAIASTTVPPTTTPPATTTTSTTRPPTTTTVPTTTSTSTSTTSTTIPARASLSIVNDHPNAMVVTVNGGDPVTVERGKPAGPVQVTPRPTDTIEVHAADDTTCKASDAGSFFQAGRSYTLTIVAGQAACTTMPAPEFTRAPS